MSEATETPPKNAAPASGKDHDNNSDINPPKRSFSNSELRKRKPLPTKRRASTSNNEGKGKPSQGEPPAKKRHPLPTLRNRRPYPGMSQPRKIPPRINIPLKGKRAIDHTGPNLGPDPKVSHPNVYTTKNKSTQTSDNDSEGSFVKGLRSVARPTKPKKNTVTTIKLVHTSRSKDDTTSNKPKPRSEHKKQVQFVESNEPPTQPLRDPSPPFNSFTPINKPKPVNED
ncbi:hypothetical protein NPX13_g7974 [Xylaria arbuscula]|uniref:Uncharacterized protein n=1 Tax=Xylaria arbuscula TaxID=114810 RepID=A0A9W8N9I4_9PEZI|nr:hypothetical protein NPX13_g7974 [Xylaria arbuscula]